MTDDADARTKWQVVLDDLEDRLARGDITDRFPTDKELVEEYGVSRHTVREAVRRLRARGLVERHRGRGSFVNADQLRQPVGTLYSLFTEVERRGHEQRSEVLQLRRGGDPEAAGRMGMPRETDLVVLARLRYVDDVPLAVDTVWLPADVGDPILGADFTHTALYAELEERAGLVIDATEETIEPIVPDADTRALLDVGDHEALFRVERRGFVDGRLVEWRVTLVRGERFAFVATWSRTGQERSRFAAR